MAWSLQQWSLTSAVSLESEISHHGVMLSVISKLVDVQAKHSVSAGIVGTGSLRSLPTQGSSLTDSMKTTMMLAQRPTCCPPTLTWHLSTLSQQSMLCPKLVPVLYLALLLQKSGFVLKCLFCRQWNSTVNREIRNQKRLFNMDHAMDAAMLSILANNERRNLDLMRYHAESRS
jgi:hypothetical protein